MKVHALKPLNHPRLGPVRKGQIVDIPEPWASRYLAMRAVERYETKVVRQGPSLAAGLRQPSSASPAAPVSQTSKLKKSDKPASAERAGSLL